MQEKINILYLDDEEQNLFSFVALFRRDYNVFTTTSAQQAVDYLSNNDVQIIFSDQKMPDVSGVEFFETIRHDYPDAVRILITGYADIDAVIDAINRGQVYRYVTKPWDANELKVCIENAIEKYNRDKELRVKNSELERVNAELEQFVYSASHDMRAPLASIKGVINVAKADGLDEKAMGYLEMIERSTNRLNDFVTNIIYYYQNTQADEELSEVDFDKLLDEVIEKYRSHDSSQRIRFGKTIAGSSAYKADVHRLKMIVSNLLSNAIKFSDLKKDDCFVDIEVIVNLEKVMIKVTDNGIGISGEEIPKIFNMFYPSTDKNSGSGVGLYIVKQAVDKMKGNCTVKSDVGIGSRFIVELPNKS
jgi:two-component system sensor histidine kinase/response regulator